MNRSDGAGYWTMGELITVDFRAGKVIARTPYWLDARTLHREALASFKVGKI